MVQNGQELMSLRVDYRHLGGASEKLSRELEVVLFQSHRGKVDDRERLIRLFLQRRVQMHGGIFELSFVQLQPGQVDEHSGRIAAMPDGSLEKRTLVLPIKCSDKRATAEKCHPQGDQDRSRCHCPTVGLAVAA